MSDEIIYRLAFSYMTGIGPVTFALLYNSFGSTRAAYEASEHDLRPLIGATTLRKFLEFRTGFDIKKTYKEIIDKKIFVLTPNSKEFPKQLESLPDPPICLFLKGDPEIFIKQKLFFAIVGTRKMSDYGARVTKQIGREISRFGFTIVSGLALGVDAEAHKAALIENGQTVAVLGCGVDIIYPAENKGLYQRIINGGGAVISEFAPGMQTIPGLFVARNRIVSGLSRGVLIVEGAEQSGTLITARLAAEQGRDVFAIPGPIGSPLSYAPNMLIKQGAILVTSARDILDEYQVKLSRQKQQSISNQLSNIQMKIFKFIEIEALTADRLSKKINQSIDQTLIILTSLELEGIIHKQDDGKYTINS